MPNFTEIEKHLDKVEFELNDAQMLIDEARHLPMQTTEFSTWTSSSSSSMSTEPKSLTRGTPQNISDSSSPS
jgi:hypothetical protein